MKFFVLALTLMPLVASGQSIQVAEMAADRCMYDDALVFLGEAPKREAESRRGRLLRARLLIQLDRGEEAVGVLASVPRSLQKSEEAERLIALGLAFSSAKRLDEADSTLVLAKEAGGDQDIVDSALGEILIQRNNLDQAEALLRAVLKRSPLLSGALYNLAVIHARRGRIAEAAALLRQSWHAGLMDPEQIRKDPDLAPVVQGPGLIDDLLKSSKPRCGSY